MENQSPTKKAYVVKFEGVQEFARAIIFINQYNAEGAEREARKLLSDSIDWKCVGVDAD
jgi:hypothetical protein